MEQSRTAPIRTRPWPGTLHVSWPVVVGAGVAVLGALGLHSRWEHSSPGGTFSSDRYSLFLDHSYAEYVGYSFAVVAAVLLGAAHRRSGEWVYGAWALALAVIAADDAFQLHERGGDALISPLGLSGTAGLRAQDIGELLVWGALGALVVAVVVLAHRASGSAARAHGVQLAAVAATLVVVAVGLDMVSIAAGDTLARYAGIAEDGAELFLLGVACAVAVGIHRSPTSEPRR